MSWYPHALKRNIPPTTNDPRIKPDTVVVHVAASNGDSLYNWFDGPSGGIESHFYVRKTGIIEQYRDTDFQADAQMGGGKDAISIETEGVAAGEWPPAQLTALKALILWLCLTHPTIPLKPVNNPNGPGIGYHSMYREWTGDARSCPGPDRIKQFNNVLVPWMLNGEDNVSTPAEIAAAVAGWDGYPSESETNPNWSLKTYIPAIYRNARAAARDSAAALSIVEAMAAKGSALDRAEIVAASAEGFRKAVAEDFAIVADVVPKPGK